VPAVGALLALSAALAAACFVKAFGITFLGRPRSPVAAEAGETDRWSQAAMLGLAALCLLAGILPGYFIDALAPVIQTLTGTSLPRQEQLDFLTIVPIAQSRSSYNGLLLFFFIALAAGLGAEVIHRWASATVRRAPAWDCGFPDPSPATQYTAGSLSQPIRRVFGSVLFRATEEVDLPPPGDTRAARLRVRLRDVPWDVLYAPIAGMVGYVADRLNRLQFLTIRGYLTLVFRRAGRAPDGAHRMAMILDALVQLCQMMVVLALAPLLAGYVRKVKALLVGRQGPPLVQPYRDLLRLLRKEVVLAHSASWVFRATPYLVFARPGSPPRWCRPSPPGCCSATPRT
jgi:hypothetical protein